MKTEASKETPRRTTRPKPSLLDQLIELSDWAARHALDTAEQKLAIEAKEKLELWKREREQSAIPA